MLSLANSLINRQNRMANKSPKLQKESVRMINSILATHAGACGNAFPPAVTESAGATRFRVGFVGAGPVVQAIHLPALARLTDKFQVTHVMDPDTQVATAVASQVDAAVVPSVSALMEAVDVVVIASPTHLHVEQLVELSANPTLATLCEKPLAASREQLTTLAQLVATVNPLVVVGTMHEFDPGWRELRRHWGSTSADRIRSLICIPDNDRFVTRATQLVPPSRERAPHAF